MNKNVEKVGKLLEKKLNDFKFIKSKHQLIKYIDTGWVAIFIDIDKKSGGKLKLSAHAHIRINELEDYYAIHNPFMLPKHLKSHTTLAGNCDSIIIDKNLINGFPDDEQSIELFVNKYANALKSDVLPWLEHYSNEDNLLNGLICQDKQARVTSDRLTIFPVGLTIYAKRGQWEEFDQLSKDFMTYCEQPFAQVHKPLAEKTIQGLENQFR